MIHVAVERADQLDVVDLIRLSDEVAEQLYPGAYRRPLDARSLDRDDILVLVARNGAGQAAGCCALFLGNGAWGELKRLIVRPDWRGRRVGRRLTEAALLEAGNRGLTLIRLEVGTRNVEARALYESMGFRDRGPFGTYRQTPISSFMERQVQKAKATGQS